MMSEHKNIVYDQWLAKIIQRDTYRLFVDDDFIKKSRDNASRGYHLLQELQSKPVFIYTKVPAVAVSAIKFLETLGFNLVDTKVVFEKPITPASEFSCHCAVRFAIPEDKNQAVELAKKSFVYSRFHQDSAIPDVVANTIKAEWVANYFAGKRGDEMVVALVDETVFGFLLLIRGSKGDLIIDLIAVDGSQRRKGIASDMIAYAESRCSDCSRMVAGTQVTNIPSIRLYEKLGFRISASQYVFHYHNLLEEEK